MSTGRSPRGRRSHRRSRRLICARGGSISARAEEPRNAARPAGRRQGRSPRGRRSRGPERSRRSSRVDLRAGGGAFSRQADHWLDACNGVDLRAGGGASLGGRDYSSDDGSISAWAEEPQVEVIARCGARVDLRAGGGARRASDAGVRIGVDLRAGGGAVSTRETAARVCEGRSPRGRRSLVSKHRS